jgi:hypothetical protein
MLNESDVMTTTSVTASRSAAAPAEQTVERSSTTRPPASGRTDGETGLSVAVLERVLDCVTEEVCVCVSDRVGVVLAVLVPVPDTEPVAEPLALRE